MKVTLTGAVQLLKLGMDGKPNCPDDGELVPVGVSDVTILCPNCYSRHDNRRLTLNLNYEKGVFNCPRCRFCGTALDLVSFYTNWDRNSVESRIQKGELGDISMVDNEPERADDSPGKEIAPLHRRHEVYTGMLEGLSLSDSHKAELMRRGLTEEQIELGGYKSTPVFIDITAIPRRLITMGLNLRHVPGFGLDRTDNWVMTKTASGFFIAGRNAMWKTQGFQIRADHPCFSTPKYGYFSSRKLSCGAACETWAHWAGPNMKDWVSNKKFDIIIVEGWLKGDICHYRTGQNFLCVPGVTALKKLYPALQSFRKIGALRDVYIAYDMDAYENEDVARQLVDLYQTLKASGYNIRILQWEHEFKGLDDWLTRPIQKAGK